MEKTQEYEQAFDEAMKIRGGRLNIEDLDIELQFLFYEFKESAQKRIDSLQYKPLKPSKNKMPYVHFDIINNPSFNAVAFIYKEKEFIGVNYGAILLLLDTFNRMLARRDILPQIGSVENEDNPDPLPFIASNYNVIQDLYQAQNLSIYVLPKDSARVDHAALLTNFAMNYLVDHEIQHLRSGHVHYATKLTGQSFISEYDTSTNKAIDPLTNRVLEYDADCFAASQAVHRLRMQIEIPNAFSEIQRKYDTTEHGVFFNWGFSMWVLFRLMDAVRTGSVQSSSNLYPTPRQRQHIAIKIAELNLDTYGTGYRSEVLMGKFTELVHDAEKAFTLITSQHLNLESLYEFLDVNPSIENSYLEELHEHYAAVVRPALMLFTRDAALPD